MHVRDKPQWLFVKLHAHGAVDRDFDALIGERAYQMHKTLNERYNDGIRYRLHYVTAREAYNIAKAAERGCEGDPSKYRDFVLPPNATRYYWADAAHRLLHCTATRVSLEPVAPTQPCRVRLRELGITEIVASCASLDVDEEAARVRLTGCAIGSTLKVILAAGTTLVSARGVQSVGAGEGASPREVTRPVEAADVILEFRRGVA